MKRTVIGAALMGALFVVGDSHAATNLLTLYHYALETNPAIRGGEFALERSGAQQRQALSKLLPRISATGSLSQNYYDSGSSNGNVSTHYQGTRTTLQATQALFDLPGYLRYKTAEAVVTQQAQEVQATRIKVAGDLIDRYLEVLEATDQIRTVTSEKEATESQLARARAMYERQLVKVTDLYEIEAYLKSLATSEIDARNARAVSLEKLREVSGFDTDDIAALVPQEFPPLTRSVSEWMDLAVRNSPTLNALRAGVRAAGTAVNGSRAEHLPLLSLSLAETRADLGYDNRSSPAYKVDSATLQLSVPIYMGGETTANIRDAVARHHMAKEDYEQNRRRVELDTRTAYSNATTSYARIASMGQEMQFREKARDAQLKSYDRGVATIVDVLDAQRRLFKARGELSKARYEYIRNTVNLRVQAGAISEGDVEEINGWLVPEARTGR